MHLQISNSNIRYNPFTTSHIIQVGSILLTEYSDALIPYTQTVCAALVHSMRKVNKCYL